MHVLSLIIISLVACISCSGASPTTKNNQNAATSGGVTDFALKDINGQTVALSDYQGDKVVVINFWAPCCEASRQITIDSQKIYAKLAARGVIFLGIAVDEPELRSQVVSLVRQRGIEYPVLFDTESDVINRLNPKGSLPYTIVIDKTGVITWMHDGYVPGDDALIEDAVILAIDAS